jgi:hypothetical protein
MEKIIVEWSTFCLANIFFQKYDLKKMTHSEIYTILSFEKKNQIINLEKIPKKKT